MPIGILMIPALSEIRLRRRILGISQKTLSGASGINQGTLAKIESGKIVPNYNIGRRLFEEIERLENSTGKTARDAMVHPIASVGPDDTLKRCAEIMSAKGFSNIPVIENGKSVGKIRDKTLLEAGTASYAKPCSEFMEPPLASVPENAPLKAVREILKFENSVIVVGNSGKARGIISRSDLL
jgi:predicted transcriptional regulator